MGGIGRRVGSLVVTGLLVGVWLGATAPPAQAECTPGIDQAEAVWVCTDGSAVDTWQASIHPTGQAHEGRDVAVSGNGNASAGQVAVANGGNATGDGLLVVANGGDAECVDRYESNGYEFCGGEGTVALANGGDASGYWVAVANGGDAETHWVGVANGGNAHHRFSGASGGCISVIYCVGRSEGVLVANGGDATEGWGHSNPDHDRTVAVTCGGKAGPGVEASIELPYEACLALSLLFLLIPPGGG